MSINANGITISVSGSSLVVNNAGTTLNFSTSGIVTKPNQIYFAATGNTGFVNLVGGNWNKITLTNVVSNVGSGYNPSLSRFTAPLDGIYFFTGTSYLNNQSANAAVYYHPLFWVNGGAGRQPNTGYYNYRMRHYGIPVASYDDGMIYQMYYLFAGDYIEYVHYFNQPDANTASYYDYYSRFSGILIG